MQSETTDRHDEPSSGSASSTATLPNLSAGHLEMGLAPVANLRWVAADITLPLEEVRRRLDLSPISAVALGRTLSAAALLHRFAFKVPHRLMIEISGDGPLGKIVAEVDDGGHLRGLVGNPQVPTPEHGELSIAWAVGRGQMRVTRYNPGGRRYSSQVELVSGELGDDITHFLHQSEQVRSAVLLGVLTRPTGIAAAGGLIVEALPGTGEEVLNALERNIRQLEGISRVLERGGVQHLLGRVLEGFEIEVAERVPLEYKCRCSRERLLGQLRTLGIDEGEELLDDEGHCRATCWFCGAEYRYGREDILGA